MRFSKDENTYILAEFTTGDTVTIDIYRLSDDVKVVDTAAVTEISSTGTFKYLFNIVVTEKTEFLLIMDNGTTDKRGKIILGGYPDDLSDQLVLVGDTVDFIKEVEGGRWKIDKNNNQMVFYKSDNVTELTRFNLFNEYGIADFENIFDRRRV